MTCSSQNRRRKKTPEQEIEMNSTGRNTLRLVLLGCAVTSLAACSSVRDWAGMGKVTPDEFAVVSKAPLIIPPDYNLRPPAPGAAPTNELPPTDAAREALFQNPADAPTAQRLPAGSYSRAEQNLLMTAHVERANPGIRKQLQSDEAAMQGANDDFTNSVLFWQPPKTTDSPLNPANANAPGAPAAPAAPPAEEKSGGWFDWLGL
jgi:hypothetical protein